MIIGIYILAIFPVSENKYSEINNGGHDHNSLRYADDTVVLSDTERKLQ